MNDSNQASENQLTFEYIDKDRKNLLRGRTPDGELFQEKDITKLNEQFHHYEERRMQAAYIKSLEQAANQAAQAKEADEFMEHHELTPPQRSASKSFEDFIENVVGQPRGAPRGFPPADIKTKKMSDSDAEGIVFKEITEGYRTYEIPFIGDQPIAGERYEISFSGGSRVPNNIVESWRDEVRQRYPKYSGKLEGFLESKGEAAQPQFDSSMGMDDKPAIAAQSAARGIAAKPLTPPAAPKTPATIVRQEEEVDELNPSNMRYLR